jgi:hypothetical protein
MWPKIVGMIAFDTPVCHLLLSTHTPSKRSADRQKADHAVSRSTSGTYHPERLYSLQALTLQHVFVSYPLVPVGSAYNLKR